jgi:uncharacterized membrane protein
MKTPGLLPLLLIFILLALLPLVFGHVFTSALVKLHLEPASALLLVPDHAPPIAFVAGVLGPLIGAGLFHLRDIEKIATGIASIWGAGTFDGIVLSGIVAAYLA